MTRLKREVTRHSRLQGCEYLGDEHSFLDMTPYKVSDFRKLALRPFYAKFQAGRYSKVLLLV